MDTGKEEPQNVQPAHNVVAAVDAPEKSGPMNEAPYPSVRALERGLDLLNEISTAGRAKPAELAKATGIDRTTVYRLLETLHRRGFVSRSDSDGSYRLSVAVRHLNAGLTDLDLVCRVVTPELTRLLSRVTWPSDFASHQMGAMIIRESTHRFSPFSIHRAMIGRTRSLTRSALGRAVLWAASEQDRAIMLDTAEETRQSDAEGAANRAQVARMLAEIDRRGYAYSVDGSEVGISAIALPVLVRRRVVGAINIIFFTRAMTPEKAADLYLADLKATADAIMAQLVPLADGEIDTSFDPGHVAQPAVARP
jgi:IclR family mhp operon transcriptional activator